MRIKSIFILINFLIGTLFLGDIKAERKDDIELLRRAIQDESSLGKEEIKWLKLMVKDVRNGEEKVKIILPVCLFEKLIRLSEEDFSEIRSENVLKETMELFNEIKTKMKGILLEIYENGKVLRIELE